LNTFSPTHFNPDEGSNMFLQNTSIHFRTTQCRNPKDYNMYNYHCINIKCCHI
jgi:hypothetical protein